MGQHHIGTCGGFTDEPFRVSSCSRRCVAAREPPVQILPSHKKLWRGEVEHERICRAYSRAREDEMRFRHLVLELFVRRLCKKARLVALHNPDPRCG